MFIRSCIHLFAGLSVQLFVGNIEFLEVNGDEVTEIGGSVNHVVHCENRIPRKTPKVNRLFLEVDDISEGECDRGEVAPLLLNPGPLFSPAEATGDAVPNDLLLSVGNHLSGQLPAPLVQLVVGQLRPDGTRTKPVDLLVGIGDEADQVITGGDEGDRINVHCGNRLHPAGEKVNGKFDLFLTIR